MFAGFSEIERTAIQKRIDAYIKHLEAKGEIVDDFHRQNIMKKAIAEHWGLGTLEKQQEQIQQNNENLMLEEYFASLPNGTRFRHKKDGSEWQKKHDSLVGSGERYVPINQLAKVLKQLEQIDL